MFNEKSIFSKEPSKPAENVHLITKPSYKKCKKND